MYDEATLAAGGVPVSSCSWTQFSWGNLGALVAASVVHGRVVRHDIELNGHRGVSQSPFGFEMPPLLVIRGFWHHEMHVTCPKASHGGAL